MFKIIIVSYDSFGDFRLLINGKPYTYTGVSMQFAQEFEHDLSAGYNKGRLLAKLRRGYGKGAKKGG